MMAAAGPIFPLLRRTAFSVLLVLGAGWTAYKGIEFVRFDRLGKAVNLVLDGDFATTPPQEFAALRARLAGWRETTGVSYLARGDYQLIGQAMMLPAATSLLDTADVVRVDPVSGWAWLDVAQAAWAVPDMQPLALAAWDMSAIAAPLEQNEMRRRLRFLMSVWPSATDVQKRRFFFEAQYLLQVRGFGGIWRQMLSTMPAEDRAGLEGEFRAYNPSYKG